MSGSDLPSADFQENVRRMEPPQGDVSAGGRWLIWLTVVMLLMTLCLIGYPVIKKQNKKAALTEARSNVHSVFYLMVEFDQDHGFFPSEKAKPEGLAYSSSWGDYSNDYFKQFYEYGYTTSEEVFFAERVGAQKPDSAAPFLGKGECGFAYVTGLSSRNHAGSPLMMAPTIPGTLAFDRDIFLGKAVILRVDGSALPYVLNERGEAVISSGHTIFDGGVGSVWGEGGFDMKRLRHPW